MASFPSVLWVMKLSLWATQQQLSASKHCLAHWQTWRALSFLSQWCLLYSVTLRCFFLLFCHSGTFLLLNADVCVLNLFIMSYVVLSSISCEWILFTEVSTRNRWMGVEKLPSLGLTSSSYVFLSLSFVWGVTGGCGVFLPLPPSLPPSLCLGLRLTVLYLFI